MKLAVLGGSFNPLHLGHLYLADSALLAFHFDRLILVPAYVSPFKRHDPGARQGQKPLPAETEPPSAEPPLGEAAPPCQASPEDRLDMILASVTGDPRISVEDLELRRGGVSYTIDTLTEIIDRYRPEQHPALILGDDLAAGFSKWKQAEELARRADIIIARRIPGPGKPENPDFPFRHRFLHNKVLDISSAMVRDRIARKKAWRYLVPPGARLIIEERGLYGAIPVYGTGQTNAPGVPADLSRIVRVEDAVREILSPSRFIHSRNTALMARDLARRWGLDQGAAYLAGIAHDMAKPLDPEALLALAQEDGKEISPLEQKNPGLLHGRAAAVLLQKYFGIHNRDVLEAVAFHTTGKKDMPDLARAVFIADKIEFSRPAVPSRLRDLAGQENGGSGELLRAVAEYTVRWLKARGLEVAEETLELLDKAGKNGETP
ncbi:MAG: bis(5'-nucleosyl)-tetraphosphatase (symmetrical) YqeK [Spirochaetaceae bacterium]|nr:bis(5'-nucleosyl)-tetraphosphatase (symmetrical) YqeK [Spirochaetaceae bacterium]